MQTGFCQFGFLGIALVASVGFPFVVESNAFAQAAPPAPGAPSGATAPRTAEVERVIVTGSLIPTAEEVGPNPVFSLNRDLINISNAATTTEKLLQLLNELFPEFGFTPPRNKDLPSERR